jgi:hypothetical protein
MQMTGGVSEQVFHTSVFPTSWTARPEQVNRQRAIQLASDYLQWYQSFAQQYANDLLAAGEEDIEGLTYVNDIAMSRLDRLKVTLSTATAAQVQFTERVFRGFRQLAELVTSLVGRGELLITLGEDAEEQLRRLGLPEDRHVIASGLGLPRFRGGEKASGNDWQVLERQR